MHKLKKTHYKSRRFQAHIFISLLLTGIIPVTLLGGFSTLFSSKIIEDTYKEQSQKKMELLVDSMNNHIILQRETIKRLSEDKVIKSSLFSNSDATKKELSSLYNILYREIQGNIDGLSLHLVRNNGKNKYSTHVLPEMYNHNTEEQILSTYLKLKPGRDFFPMVNSFINPKGDRVAFSMFQKIESENGEKGFVIIDVNSEVLGRSLEKINTSFFSDLYIIDSINHKHINLLRESSSGNFTNLQNSIPPGQSGIMRSQGTLITYDTLYPTDLMLVGTIKYDTVKANMSILTRIILFLSIGGVIISSIIAYWLSKNITEPVIKLTKAMKQVEEGEFSVQVEKFNEDEFETLFHGFNNMSSQIKNLLDARVEREKALRTAERLALQAQINPHFLYNTLNTVKAISKLNNVPEITTIITELGKLLRNSIDSQEEFTTVGDSLELIEAYLQIQKFRYGSNFNWNIKKDPLLSNRTIPRLIIQPIVENSVIHGLEKLVGDKQVNIICQSSPPSIIVQDNGQGMTIPTWDRAISGGTGIGLENVHKRLKLYYGEAAGLTYSNKEKLSSVMIHL